MVCKWRWVSSIQNERPFQLTSLALSSNRWSLTTISRCVKTHLPRLSSSQRILRRVISNENVPGSSQLLTVLPRKKQIAAPSTRILFSVGSRHTSGPYSCINTSTIISDSSMCNRHSGHAGESRSQKLSYRERPSTFDQRVSRYQSRKPPSAIL